MGGVLSAAPIGEAAVEFIRAGGDLCLICHRENYITQAYEELLKTAERDREVCAGASRNQCGGCWHSRRNQQRCLRRTKTPSAATVEKLSRKLWEFGEQVRLEALRSVSDRDRAYRGRGA